MKCVQIPDPYAHSFRALLGRDDVRFFADVKRIDREGKKHDRCLVVVGSETLLLCTQKGVINRIVNVHEIEELILAPGGECLLRVPTEHDVHAELTSDASRRLAEVLEELAFVKVERLPPQERIGDAFHFVNYGVAGAAGAEETPLQGAHGADVVGWLLGGNRQFSPSPRRPPRNIRQQRILALQQSIGARSRGQQARKPPSPPSPAAYPKSASPTSSPRSPGAAATTAEQNRQQKPHPLKQALRRLRPDEPGSSAARVGRAARGGKENEPPPSLAALAKPASQQLAKAWRRMRSLSPTSLCPSPGPKPRKNPNANTPQPYSEKPSRPNEPSPTNEDTPPTIRNEPKGHGKALTVLPLTRFEDLFQRQEADLVRGLCEEDQGTSMSGGDSVEPEHPPRRSAPRDKKWPARGPGNQRCAASPPFFANHAQPSAAGQSDRLGFLVAEGRAEHVGDPPQAAMNCGDTLAVLVSNANVRRRVCRFACEIEAADDKSSVGVTLRGAHELPTVTLEARLDGSLFCDGLPVQRTPARTKTSRGRPHRVQVVVDQSLLRDVRIYVDGSCEGTFKLPDVSALRAVTPFVRLHREGDTASFISLAGSDVTGPSVLFAAGICVLMLSAASPPPPSKWKPTLPPPPGSPPPPVSLTPDHAVHFSSPLTTDQSLPADTRLKSALATRLRSPDRNQLQSSPTARFPSPQRGNPSAMPAIPDADKGALQTEIATCDLSAVELALGEILMGHDAPGFTRVPEPEARQSTITYESVEAQSRGMPEPETLNQNHWLTEKPPPQNQALPSTPEDARAPTREFEAHADGAGAERRVRLPPLAAEKELDQSWESASTIQHLAEGNSPAELRSMAESGCNDAEDVALFDALRSELSNVGRDEPALCLGGDNHLKKKVSDLQRENEDLLWEVDTLEEHRVENQTLRASVKRLEAKVKTLESRCRRQAEAETKLKEESATLKAAAKRANQANEESCRDRDTPAAKANADEGNALCSVSDVARLLIKLTVSTDNTELPLPGGLRRVSVEANRLATQLRRQQRLIASYKTQQGLLVANILTAIAAKEFASVRSLIRLQCDDQVPEGTLSLVVRSFNEVNARLLFTSLSTKLLSIYWRKWQRLVC
ncbi:hypothetical protein DIPPA_31284 [Diplonema papillatum]|nr:hypothetical protein DIPPA_31284 [Diplonema papillatum]